MKKQFSFFLSFFLSINFLNAQVGGAPGPLGNPFGVSQIRSYQDESFPASSSFIENKGQLQCFDEDHPARGVNYYSAQRDAFDFVMDDRIAFVSANFVEQDTSDMEYYEVNRVDLFFLDGQTSNLKPLSHTFPIDVLPTKGHYYSGNTSIENVSWHRELYAEDLYPGVNLSITHNNIGIVMFFEFEVNGETPNSLNFDFDGINGVGFSNGSINLQANGLDLVMKKPVAYQFDVLGNVEFVPASYVVKPNGHYGFSVGNYDPLRELYISTRQGENGPSRANDGDNLEWSSYLGEAGKTVVYGTHENKGINSGGVVYCGSSDRPNFLGNLNNNSEVFAYSGGGDAFIASFDASIELANYTYLGGATSIGPCEASEFCSAIDISTTGEIFATGHTMSSDFPLVYQSGEYSGDLVNDATNDCSNAGDIFYARFNSDLTMSYSSIYGSTLGEFPADILLLNDRVYIVGEARTNTPTIIENGSYNSGTGNGFIMSYSLSNQLPWVTKLDVAEVSAITNDEDGKLIIAGATLTNNNSFPVVNASQAYLGYNSRNAGALGGFITIFNPSRQITHSSHYDGPGEEWILDLESFGNVIVGTGIAKLDFNAGSQNLLPVVADPQHPNYSNIVNSLSANLFGGTTSGYEDHFFFKFNSPINSAPIEFSLAGFLGGSQQEFFDLFGNFTISRMNPACEIIDGETIIIAGTTNSNDIELPDCNPIHFYAKRNRQNPNLSGDIYMMALNNDGEIIYSSYFGDGSKFDALTSMSYSSVNQRLYFGGNSTTLNGPTHQNTSPTTQLYMEEFDENSSNDFIKKELGSDVSGQSGTGYVGMLDLEGIYMVEDPCIAGIDDSFSAKASQVVFPNPFNAQFQLRNIEGLNKEDLVLRDINGKSCSLVVVQESADFWKINSANLTPGIYILSFVFKTETVQFKIVKL